MKEGRYSQAHSRFEEALKTAESENYERSMAYIQFHLGELYQVENKLKKAEILLDEACMVADKEGLFRLAYKLTQQQEKFYSQIIQ